MSRCWTSSSAWLLIGALSALGRPGIDLPPFFYLGLGWLLHNAICVARLRTALSCSLCFGVGLFGVMGIGGISWGWPVPVGIVVTSLVAYLLPVSCLSRWAGRRLSPAGGTALVASGGSLLASAADHLDLPFHMLATSAITWFPGLLGGARLCGMPIVEGVLLGSVFGVAVHLARPARGGYAATVAALRSAGIGLSLLGSASLFAHLRAPSQSGELRVGIAQINVDSSYYDSRVTAPGVVSAFETQLTGLLDQLRDTELVAFPETFDGRYGLLVPSLMQRWSEHARRHGQALLVTSYLPEPSGAKSNAAGLFSKDGALAGIHRKVVLAPYGESTLSAGSHFRPLWLDGGVGVGVLICQESMSGKAARTLVQSGAQLLAATTSDISFGSSLLGFEHLAATRLRAIETGRTIIWASNGGPSGVIDRWGGAGRFGPFRQAVAVKTGAALFAEVTPYVRLRWLWLALQLAAIVSCAWLNRRGLFSRRLPFDQAEPSDQAARMSRGWSPRRVLYLTAQLLAASALVLGSPVLVEARSGLPARALLAVRDLYASKPHYRESDPLSRFRSPDAVSSAVAYFLTYYGASITAEEVPRALSADLAGARRVLSEVLGVATREYDLRPGLPRIAALVELVDGSIGVLAQPGNETAWLFQPRTAELIHAAPATIAARVRSPALLPESPADPRH